MSDQADREQMGDDLGVWSVDPEDQLQPEDTLDGDGDVLDRGYRVEDRYHGVLAHGVTADEQAHEETIDQRLRQEEPDPYSRTDVDDETTEDDGLVGGDDPDAVRRALGADDDSTRRVGRIIDPGEGDDQHHDSHLLVREGRATSWDAPEESAMHYCDGSEDELLEDEWLPSDGTDEEE